MRTARGDFIHGGFLQPSGAALGSTNPATGEPVFETRMDPARAAAACDAASAAFPAWRRLSLSQRWDHLTRFRDAIEAKRAHLSSALTQEIGKIASEANAEISALVGRFAMARSRIEEDLRSGPLPGFPMEALRYAPIGVVGVIGPFNFPLHLCHAYATVAMLAGNTVVIKPSEIAPLSAELYAEAASEAELPPGVFNLVHGDGAAGQALAEHPALRGLFFTGSSRVGIALRKTLVARPEVLLALEMGGKNASVVWSDADLRQAVVEIMLGGYLTTGQRCTCTDRVLVHRAVAEPFLERLGRAVKDIGFGDPQDAGSFAGPLATREAAERLDKAIALARGAGATCIAEGRAPVGDCFRAPTLHLVPADRAIEGYLDQELFGPDLAVEIIESEEQALERLNDSPYGFVHSIFTEDDARFERFSREVQAGMWNYNRGTNRASPRLPFGGVGHSGNYRPGGGFAQRSVTFAVAEQRQVHGALEPHPLVHPGDVDLEELERRHASEEEAEAIALSEPTARPLMKKLPQAGKLPRSERFLERLYAGGRMAKEKKPGVFDHMRSAGGWFCSVDDEPLCVLDGMSQTATSPAGFYPHDVVRAYFEGGFENSLTTSDPAHAERAEAAFAETLREAVPGFPHVTFTNSGAEACEKALALCRGVAGAKQVRVLAFEGGFHGRTLLSLHASHNPKKREPFQIAGYEVDFAPFPVWWTPEQPEPVAPPGFLEAAGAGDYEQLERFEAQDALLDQEVQALVFVGKALAAGELFAVIVEPMQSEGGDRYATARFHRALRLLTRAFDVPLIYDEVQTGFGLGGSFVWHSRFDLVDRMGNPDGPDCVTFAKRAQVGIVMSWFKDPEPTSVHGASLVRGRLHAEMVKKDTAVGWIEARVREMLAELGRRHPDLVINPRVCGYASAFDMPSPTHLAHYLAQRFWRGNIVFAAGARTVRHRLSSAFGEAELEVLFDAMHRSLSLLEAQPGVAPPAWLDLPTPPAADLSAEFRVRQVEPEEKETFLDELMELEARLFEPNRRDSRERLALGFEPGGLALVAERKTQRGDYRFCGACVGASLEAVADTPGPDRSPLLGKGRVFYTVSLAVAPGLRGYGIGRALKRAQLLALRDFKDSQGKARYAHATGRNRVGLADAMWRLNRSFGAYEVDRLQRQYGEDDAEALYYRQSLGAPRPDPLLAKPVVQSGLLEVSRGVERPFAAPVASLAAAYEAGALFGPAINKITICNYITPAIVRGVEWVSALTPGLPHLYLTSSRDEAFDKTLRAFRYARPKARIALGFAGGYVGHTSAAARSLSDPAATSQGPPHFEAFARVPHPEESVEATMTVLKNEVAAAGGPDHIIGLFLEPLQERTGRTVPDGFWPALEAFRRDTGIPVAFVESSSAHYRSGKGPFAASGIEFVPDAILWWGGGQIGFVHMTTAWFISQPLMMVSTWDGDELSLIRVAHQLRAARRVDIGAISTQLDRALEPAAARGLLVRGQGAYRVLDVSSRSLTAVDALKEAGVRPRLLPNEHIVIAPAYDEIEMACDRISKALGRLA